MISYTRNQIVEKCETALNNIRLFYTQDFINYTGKTTDTNELYTEVIAEFILHHIKDFKAIKPISRGDKTYRVEHTGEYNKTSNRCEEKEAMDMYNQSKKDMHIGEAGEILNYQIPIYGKKDDKIGKIDLLSRTDDAVYVLELKREDSTETLLRCVIEGYTYMKSVEKDKLLGDYDIPKDTTLKTAPFVYENSRQWKEYQDIVNRPNLKKLMETLDENPIVPFFISKDIMYTSKRG